MTLIEKLKLRLSRPSTLLPALAAVAVLGTAGGYAVHQQLRGDCCYPGSPCCHPGAPCCAGHSHGKNK